MLAATTATQTSILMGSQFDQRGKMLAMGDLSGFHWADGLRIPNRFQNGDFDGIQQGSFGVIKDV